MPQSSNNIAIIRGYHAHAYFDAATRDDAVAVSRALLDTFDVRFGGMRENAVGLHPRPFWIAAFTPAQFDHVVPWLMLNRRGLSVLVHPMTGDEAADHGAHAMWLGQPLALDIDRLRPRRALTSSIAESQPAL